MRQRDTGTVQGNPPDVGNEARRPFPSKAEIRAMPLSPYAMCCFCGGHVLRTEAVTLKVGHPHYKTVQSMWAPAEHVQDAVRPSGIDIAVCDQLLRGDPSESGSGNI